MTNIILLKIPTEFLTIIITGGTLLWTIVSFFINYKLNGNTLTKIEDIKLTNEKKTYITKSMYDFEIEMFKVLSVIFNKLIYSLNFLKTLYVENNELCTEYHHMKISHTLLHDTEKQLLDSISELEDFIDDKYLFLNNFILILLQRIVKNSKCELYQKEFWNGVYARNDHSEPISLFLYDYILKNYTKFDLMLNELLEIVIQTRDEIKNYISNLQAI